MILGSAARTLSVPLGGDSCAVRPWQQQPRGEAQEDCFHLALPRHLAVRAGRAAAGGKLREWGAGSDTAEMAELLVSELATNAARFSSGEITLTLWRMPGILVIEVSDEAENAVPVLLEPGTDSEHGRGMVLVDAISREWAYYVPRPGWKTVYAILDADQW